MGFGEHAMQSFPMLTAWAPRVLVGAVGRGGPGTSHSLVIRRKGAAPRMEVRAARHYEQSDGDLTKGGE